MNGCLRELKLSYCRIGDDAGIGLFIGLSKNNSLIKLKLCSN
jgi:hypothetical protein